MKKSFRSVITRTLLAGSLFFLLSVSGCGHRSDWVMFRGEQGRGYTPNSLHPPVGIKWKLKIQENINPAFAFNNPVVLKDTIYFGSVDGNIYALDIVSGYMRWVYKTKGTINSVPYADNKNVYIGSNDGKVYAVSQKDGKEAWSFQTDSTVQSTILKYKDSIIFVSDGGHVYFLSADGSEQFTLPNPVWHYFTFQVYDDVFYFAPGPVEQPHSMGAYDIKQKRYLWVIDTSRLNAVWYSFPALKDNSIFFSTMDPFGEEWELTYYAFNRKTGALQWRNTDYAVWGKNMPSDMGDYITRNMQLLDYLAPSLWKNLVIYTSGDSVVRAFSTKTGDLVWQHRFDTPVSSAPTVAGNRIYFGLHGGTSYPVIEPKLVCLSARNGKVLWELETEGALLSAPVIAHNWIIFGTDKNVFYVLEALF
ncbi:MAG: PQQ-binding-like beta-propeller repeat protein [Spirochaetota bacterium]